MKVRLSIPVLVRGSYHGAGEVVDLPGRFARALLAERHAERWNGETAALEGGPENGMQRGRARPRRRPR